MSLLSLIKKYISVQISKAELDIKREEESIKLIEKITFFISSGELNKLIDIWNMSYIKEENHQEFSSSDKEKDEIQREVAYNMETNPIPYLVEMLNTDICNTMEELYGKHKFNSNHPIEWSPHIYTLDKILVRDLIKLLTSKDKKEIINLFTHIFEHSDHEKLLSFYRIVQTKASNKIISTLFNLIADEKLK